jgi:hypothetical protein
MIVLPITSKVANEYKRALTLEDSDFREVPVIAQIGTGGSMGLPPALFRGFIWSTDRHSEACNSLTSQAAEGQGGAV